MKKIIALAVAALITCSTFAACGVDINLTEEDKEFAKEVLAEVIQNEKETAPETEESTEDIFPEVSENTETVLPETSEETETVLPETSEETEPEASPETPEETPAPVIPEEKPAETPVEKPQENPQEKPICTRFTNYDLNGRWSQNAITVVPAEVYYENGRLVANCYIVNGYNTLATQVNIPTLIVYGADNVVIADGGFANQNLTINAQSYLCYTFTFGGDALELNNADLSFLRFHCEFSARH